MALPVSIKRSRAFDPFELARNDFGTMLSHLFSGEAGDNPTLSVLGTYGVDIREDADHLYVEADLPGFRKEDVNVSLENGTLTITAERREEMNPQAQKSQGADQNASGSQQKEEYLLRERRIQRFVRSFTLPPNIDEHSVQAHMDNGVLTITLNKREESKPKRIQIS